jgi:hypothetical protein
MMPLLLPLALACEEGVWLYVEVEGEGTVQDEVDGASINCPGVCSKKYPFGFQRGVEMLGSGAEYVLEVLVATPLDGWEFDSWDTGTPYQFSSDATDYTGGECLAAFPPPTCGIQFNREQRVKAIFKLAEGDVCEGPPRNVAFNTGTPVPQARPAAYGQNLLFNEGFEEAGAVWTVAAPSDFGYWSFDQAVSVPAQQGITPRTGQRMLHFVGTSVISTPPLNTTASEQLHLVDLTAIAADVDAGRVRATAQAWFNRIESPPEGCSEMDDAFGVQIIAFDGVPATFPSRWVVGVNTTPATDDAIPGSWLLRRRVSARHLEPGAWRAQEVAMDVPPGTRFLVTLIFASENRVNDTAFPELHGQYGDDASLVLECVGAGCP